MTHLEMKELRKRLHLTLRDVAKACNMAHTTIFYFEYGRDISSSRRDRLEAFYKNQLQKKEQDNGNNKD